jgi:hypothetical protein
LGGTPTGLALALLSEFAGDLRESKTINQLALSTGKAYANVHAAANVLLNENILTREIVGHSHRCRLNLSNDKTLLYIGLAETIKRDNLLKADPGAKELLHTIDRESGRLGILLAWKRDNDLLIITTNSMPDAQHRLKIPTTALPLAAFLHDAELRATIGKHTLLFGHALYASLLREQRMEVLR